MRTVAPQSTSSPTQGPNVAWLAGGFVLAGVGTVLLGPILPTVSARWHLTDAAAGSLLFAKFLGAFAGGATVLRRLRLAVLAATALACAGFAAFSMATGVVTGALALFVAGLGLGQLIASSNILAARRYSQHPGSALAALNFFWSLGAVGAGVLAASLLPHFGLRELLLSLASAFLLVGLGGAANWMRSSAAPTGSAEPNGGSLPRSTFAVFAALLLLYGGLETSLSSWLTTFDLRYSAEHLLGGQSALILLWSALTVGRLVAFGMLRSVGETAVLRLSLLLSFAFILLLAVTSHAWSLSGVCALLGLSLAAFFPACFGLLMRHNPSAREAGFILATSGIGAAVFPWLMGIVSTHTGSLRLAMLIPAGLAVLLLGVTFAIRTPHPEPHKASHAQV